MAYLLPVNVLLPLTPLPPLRIFRDAVRAKDKKDLERQLVEEARGCQWLVLWLDCDREGENIAYEVIEVRYSGWGL